MTVAERRRHRVLDGAKADIRRAVRWYERQAAGAGAFLLLAIDEGVGEVLEAPHRWPPIDANYQRYLLQRYPYSVIYRIHDEMVFFVAVAHHSREPDYWRGRDRPPPR